MKKYLAEHNKGIAGVDEKTIESDIIEAQSPKEALAMVTDWPYRQEDEACYNPDVIQGGSGKYNDYWMATAGWECKNCGSWELDSDDKCDLCGSKR